MQNQKVISKEYNIFEPTKFDYENTDWPRDFDIRDLISK